MKIGEDLEIRLGCIDVKADWKCLQRQIDEGLRIQRKEAEGGILVNGKKQILHKQTCGTNF